MTAATLKIRLYGDPCLRTKCVPVKKVGAGERVVIKAMIETMHQAKGIGLAAPQVGINQRFFVADIGNGPIALINPQIIKKEGSGLLEEGCLSIPDVNIVVDRAQKITVRYVDENNQKMEMTCEDLLARVIQHETDHLDGILIVDYASKEENERFKEQLKFLEVESRK